MLMLFAGTLKVVTEGGKDGFKDLHGMSDQTEKAASQSRDFFVTLGVRLAVLSQAYTGLEEHRWRPTARNSMFWRAERHLHDCSLLFL